MTRYEKYRIGDKSSNEWKNLSLYEKVRRMRMERDESEFCVMELQMKMNLFTPTRRSHFSFGVDP